MINTIHLILLSVFFLSLGAHAQAQAETARVDADIPYKTVPGRKHALLLDLYYPATASATKVPLVVYTHGGGWAAGSKNGAKAGLKGKAIRGLVKKGFCVASVNYRLCKKGGNIAMKDCVIDCKDALRFLVKHSEKFAIDPEQIFTFGDSAGGHLAQMLALSTPEQFSGDATLAGQTYKVLAGVSWYGPCDFEKTALFNHDGRADFRDRFGARIMKPDARPADKLDLYREMSPINYLKQTSPPLLMIQGDRDTTIPVHHAHYMKEKAAAAKSPVSILIIKNAGHNWRKVDAPIDPAADVIVARTVDFLVQHLPD